MYDIVMVHGRFQPFHKEHLAYVLRALKLAKRLCIGITNPEPSEYILNKDSDHRHLTEANPFSYVERQDMILRSLSIEGVDLSLIRCVPFHVFDERKWSCFLPNMNETTQVIRIFSDWERGKADKLRNYGFNVHILDEDCTKGMTATEIRERIRGGLEWQHMVPVGTKEVIIEVLASKKGLKI